MRKRFLYLFILANFCWNALSGAASAQNPILILGKAGQFDDYTGEILKAEGFNAFTVGSVSAAGLSLPYLQGFDVVILTETDVNDHLRGLLTTYVQAGGNLIAFRPDKKLYPLFGVKDKKQTITDGYLGIDISSAIGKGLLANTLQFHGSADGYSMNGGQKIASLYSNATTATLFPALAAHTYGKGHALAFAYNLPQNILLTRQGNPLSAGQEKDGIPGLRAMDLFTDKWVDTSRNMLNQADEQMRLLSHCLEWLSGFKKPLPRFWYFPDTLQCLVTLNNDGENSVEADIKPQFTDIEAKRANMTLYILETEKVSKEAVDGWIKNGNEISGHPDDTKNAEHPDWQNMNAAMDTKLGELKDRYGIDGMRTVVNHWFVWCGTDANGNRDFTAQAKIEISKKIEMDINYAHYDNGSNKEKFLGPLGARQGNYTGSGLPLKFADEKGATLNIYQALNNVYDQQYMENHDSIGFFECFKALVDRSLDNEAYSYVTVKCHNNEYGFSKIPLSKMLDYANEKHIPVWTCEKMLDFLKARDAAAFRNIQWTGNRLSFDIQSPLASDRGLTCLIPYRHGGSKITGVGVGKAKSAFTVKKIKGVEYALLTVKPGSDHTVSVTYVK